MKLTIIRTAKNGKKFLHTRTIEKFMERIMADTKEGDVSRMRRDIDFLNDGEREYQHMKSIPRVFPAAEMTIDKQGNIRMKEMNGVVLLTVDHLNGGDEVSAVKEMAKVMPMTLAAFVGSSGRSVKILVKTAPVGKAFPQVEDEANRLYERAYELVARVYDSMLPSRLRMMDSSLLSPTCASFRMTLDEEPYLNLKAMPIQIPDMPLMARLRSDDDVAKTLNADDGNTVGQETRDLIKFLDKNYRFRFNSVMGYTEYSRKTAHAIGWLPVDERMQNRMSMEARLAGLNVWDKDVNRYIKSGLIREYNPVHEYLWRVRGTWDGKDHIGRLASCVPTNNPHWQQWFRTWFLAMVAQWMGKSRQYGNSVAPLLVSRQGYNKSTFCKSLIPRELQWGYNDNLQMNEKKSVLQAMSQFLLINLDEFNAISPAIQEGFLKNVIQLASVKVKRPYGKHVEEFPRLASFIATANMTDILVDPSGNRRFIGVELTAPIDVSQRIDHEQLYAQALEALDNNEPYWFDDQQTQLIMTSNRQFEKQPPVIQLFHECFEVIQDANDGEYISAAAIFNTIRKVAGSGLRLNALTSFGRILASIPDLKRRRTSKGTEYLVKERRKNSD